MVRFVSDTFAIGLLCGCHLALAFPPTSLQGSSANASAKEQNSEQVFEDPSLSQMEFLEHEMSTPTRANTSEDMIRQLAARGKMERNVLKLQKAIAASTKEGIALLKQANFKDGYDAALLLDKLRQAQALQAEVAGLIENALAVSARLCARTDDQGRCAQGFSCTSVAALVAQGQTFWLPCGALTISRNKEDMSQRPLCPPQNIITAKEECMSAARQLRQQWEAKVESGLPLTETTSHLLMRAWFLSDPFWQRHSRFQDHGFEPEFRDAWAGGNSKAPLGCSMDMNGGYVYWNDYKMDQSRHEWEQGATYTGVGGLMHVGYDGSQKNVGICKA